MKIQNFSIPPECRHASVEAVDNRLIITFEPENLSDFFCQETDHIEQTPK